MNSEQRAMDWFSIAPKHRTVERLAAFIRDVENDVLELAAKAADMRCEDDMDPYGTGAEIRALKHPQ